jgi:hypothetical protein
MLRFALCGAAAEATAGLNKPAPSHSTITALASPRVHHISRTSSGVAAASGPGAQQSSQQHKPVGSAPRTAVDLRI